MPSRTAGMFFINPKEAAVAAVGDPFDVCGPGHDIDGVRRGFQRSMACGSPRLHWNSLVMRAVGPATPSKMSSPPDSRAFRLDVPETVRWFDLDFPEVIALRRRLYPERDRCRLLAYSATDPGWLNELPADRPILVVAEGVLPYIASVDVRQLFVRLTDRLPAVLARASSPVNTWLRCALSPQRIPVRARLACSLSDTGIAPGRSVHVSDAVRGPGE